MSQFTCRRPPHPQALGPQTQPGAAENTQKKVMSTEHVDYFSCHCSLRDTVSQLLPQHVRCTVGASNPGMVLGLWSDAQR